jgi:hypothetical protein
MKRANRHDFMKIHFVETAVELPNLLDVELESGSVVLRGSVRGVSTNS